MRCHLTSTGTRIHIKTVEILCCLYQLYFENINASCRMTSFAKRSDALIAEMMSLITTIHAVDPIDRLCFIGVGILYHNIELSI